MSLRASLRRRLRIRDRMRAVLHDLRHTIQPAEYTRGNPYRIGFIDPRRVSHLTRYCVRLQGRRLPGDWDLEMAPITATPLHRGLVQRFVDELPWLETVLHPDRYTPLWPDRSTRYVHYTVSQFLEHGAALDRLYDSLRTHGYRHPYGARAPVDQVMGLAIARDGRVARNRRGLHRLILAQILGLDRIPARIVAVHAELEVEPDLLAF